MKLTQERLKELLDYNPETGEVYTKQIKLFNRDIKEVVSELETWLIARRNDIHGDFACHQ